MDEFYDIARAFNTVQKHAKESMSTSCYHMSGIIMEGEQMSEVSLQKDTDDSVWRLAKDNGDDAEELVFSCTGVMCEANLPPIEMKLTAEREFKHGMLDKWTPSTYRGFPMFTLSNRYFRTMKEGAQHEAVPFSDDVKPVGILQCLGKIDVVHTKDNIVQYFKAHTDNEGKRRFQRARPQLFRIGDVVEVQCSIIVFKTKVIKHRMKLVLCAIALLDCNIALDAKRKSNKQVTAEQSSSKCLKHKIRFTEDEVDEGTASKRARDWPTMDESA
ncbi:hypothetical protein EDD18DRAFT_1356273 [Armillaria luteobubalina]|uniref:Uncharacterized protein n=1 Tax=Armillaria luteobubalina TaxID=153913 RepID=A0AA39TLB4_9AGAR|nr:hypothetical protein EDD18DRAFT_1356273 [Armillaria luteobubalina]